MCLEVTVDSVCVVEFEMQGIRVGYEDPNASVNYLFSDHRGDLRDPFKINELPLPRGSASTMSELQGLSCG